MHSKYEPGGRVSVEAMAAGLPVIATACGFAKDMIHDWENGFLIDFGNVKKLSERMSFFILQPFLSDSLGECAKITAKSYIENWGFLKHHIFVYDTIISGNKEFLFNTQSVATPRDNYPWGIVKKYPFKQKAINDDYLLEMISSVSNDDKFIILRKKPFVHIGCFVWSIQGSEQNYCAVQTYDQINIYRILDQRRYSKMITADDKYNTALIWKSLCPTNQIVTHDSKGNVIICSGDLILSYDSEKVELLFNYIEKTNIYFL